MMLYIMINDLKIYITYRGVSQVNESVNVYSPIMIRKSPLLNYIALKHILFIYSCIHEIYFFNSHPFAVIIFIVSEY